MSGVDSRWGSLIAVEATASNFSCVQSSARLVPVVQERTPALQEMLARRLHYNIYTTPARHVDKETFADRGRVLQDGDGSPSKLLNVYSEIDPPTA